MGVRKLGSSAGGTRIEAAKALRGRSAGECLSTYMKMSEFIILG
jgi:hypothetical protein